jgi:hypothetical protein
MDTAISGSVSAFNDTEVRMLLVVDDDSGDQRSQLIFLLLLWCTTKHWEWSQSTFLCQLIFNTTWYDLYLFKLGESMLMLIKQLNWKSEEYHVKVKYL